MGVQLISPVYLPCERKHQYRFCKSQNLKGTSRKVKQKTILTWIQSEI